MKHPSEMTVRELALVIVDALALSDKHGRWYQACQFIEGNTGVHLGPDDIEKAAAYLRSAVEAAVARAEA
jgi:hypothetical protein